MRFPAFFSAQTTFFVVVLAGYLVWLNLLLPKFNTKSHYEVLGVQSGCTTEDIALAYKKLSRSRDDATRSNDLRIQHAYEILSDPLRRRDYDNFNQDELREKVSHLQKQLNALSKTSLPLWEPFSYENADVGVHSLTGENFEEVVEGTESWLIQIYSIASYNCWKHEAALQHIYEKMDGVAKFGRVELGEKVVATYFADKNIATGGYTFRNGLPAYVAFPSNCRSQDCIMRYTNEVSADGVVDWMTSQVLRLPRILYYSPQTLVSNFLKKAGPHKVKVVIISLTGERASPFIRKAAKEFWDFAAFGIVLWREENAMLWENMLGVHSAPAVVILRDPGVQPTIVYGKMNSSVFEELMRRNKNHALPQLRTVTVQEVGCSETGYSLAGKDVHTWYCVIVAGRPSLELSQARAVLRDVQDNLTKEAFTQDGSSSHFSSAVSAFKEKRLSLAWLDGAVQKQLCQFFLNSETVHETCGAKRFPEQADVPQVFIVRYQRNTKEHEKVRSKKTHFNTIWQKLLEEDENLASQIVAKYNGSLEMEEIMLWASAMISQGDTQDLLFYMKKAPPLVSEESKPAWVTNAQSYLSVKGQGLFQKSKRLLVVSSEYLNDPTFATTVAVVLVMYIGGLLFTSKRANSHLT